MIATPLIAELDDIANSRGSPSQNPSQFICDKS